MPSSTDPQRAPSGADIEAAARRIAPWVRTTPLLSLTLPELPGTTIELKLEFMQISGTFKARGAFARLLRARDEAGDTGQPLPERVVAASGGNHGIAVAHAAYALGMSADIFVPRTAPSAKLQALRALGATVHAEGEDYAQALQASQQFTADTGALVSHAYDQFDTLAGQATLAREWLQQTHGLDVMLVAVGGGGLIGGMAAWIEAQAAQGAPVPTLIAVESTACATLGAAMSAGRIVDIQPGGLAADSLGARRVGELMFPLAQRRIAQCVQVSDDAIRAAQRRLWSSARIAVEPGGATALAALSSGAWTPAPGLRVGVLVCGANVDLASFPGPAA